MPTIEGHIVFNDFEGGFWGILAKDGTRYCPVDLPREFQEKGLAIKAHLERVNIMSTRMWGLNVEIKDISLLTP